MLIVMKMGTKVVLTYQMKSLGLEMCNVEDQTCSNGTGAKTKADDNGEHI